MSPESPTVVYCSLIVVACCSPLFAAASDSDSPKLNFREMIINTEDANPQRYYYTTDASIGTCCGTPTVDSIMRDERRRTREIPLDVILKLNKVENISQLFTEFMPDVDMNKAKNIIATTGFQTRSLVNVERKAVLIPKPASCSVESKTISLKDTDDQSLYYYPPCTRVNRCGGCCAHDLLACQPTKTEKLQFEVMVSQYNEGKLEFIGRKLVSVDQDVTCKCDCIVQPKDCSPLQIYYKKECRCICTNDEDRQKCDEERNVKKLWNPATCTCQCIERQDCTTGFTFDHDSCSCESIRTKTKNTSYEFNRNIYTLGET